MRQFLVTRWANTVIRLTSPKERRSQLYLSVGSSVIAKLITAGVSIASLPLAVHYLGVERYGVWITVTTTVTWISILDLGIADTLIGCIARASDFEERQRANEQVANALFLTVSIAIIGSYLTWVSRNLLPWDHLLEVTNRKAQQDTASTLLCGVFVIFIGLPSNLFYKILAGYQELQINNMIYVVIAFSSLSGLLLGMHFGLSMPLLFLATVGMNSWIPLLGLVWLLYMYKPWLVPQRRSLSLAGMRNLLTSGSSFLIINISGIIAFGSDNLVIGHFLSSSQVTPYAVTWRLAGYAGILQSLLFPALWPAFAKAFHTGDMLWVRRALAWSIGCSFAVNVCMLILLLSMGKVIIGKWAGSGAVPTFSLLLAVGCWNVIAGFMSAQSKLSRRDRSE